MNSKRRHAASRKRSASDGYDARQPYPLVAGAFGPRELTFDRCNGCSDTRELRQSTVFANTGGWHVDASRVCGFH